MKTLFATILGLTIVTSSFAAEKKLSTADHLQNVSVTIRSEGQFSNGEGSGVIFSRKDKDGNLVKVMHHRFDRLEEKIDDMKNGRS